MHGSERGGSQDGVLRPHETTLTLAVPKTAMVQSLNIEVTILGVASWSIRDNSDEGRTTVITQSERAGLVRTT